MLILGVEITPAYGQVLVMGVNAQDFPDWETGDESVVSTSEVILIKTQSDVDGDVPVVIQRDATEAEGLEVFSGDLSIPDGVLVVGNPMAGDTYDLDLSPSTSVRLQISVDQIESPSRIWISLA